MLHAILDFIVDGYLPAVETIEESVLKIEQYALDNFLVLSAVKLIFVLRGELIRFQRILDRTSLLDREPGFEFFSGVCRDRP